MKLCIKILLTFKFDMLTFAVDSKFNNVIPYLGINLFDEN